MKLDEYNKCPLSAQLGFIHAIPEEEFDIATATIIDAGFLGFFSKKIFQMLRKYDREMDGSSLQATYNFNRIWKTYLLHSFAVQSLFKNS